jgi:hypothetical protein
MKLLHKTGFIALLVAFVTMVGPTALAATSPSLGAANSFVILSGTYSNSVSGTTLNGDLGYTTPPAVAPTVNGTTHVADSTYNQAGIDQGNALTQLNSQPCSFTFAPGPIDLASDTTHGPVGVYTPGIYCANGAVAIGGGGTVTLNGTGTFIFRMDGALTSSANSVVKLAGGASACDVWWTPTQATTLGATSTFVGTDIDASGITIGSTVTWQGQALAFGGTVTTTSDTITNPTCSTGRSATPVTTSATTPGLPNTGLGVLEPSRTPWIVAGIVTTVLLVGAGYGIRRKHFSA